MVRYLWSFGGQTDWSLGGFSGPPFWLVVPVDPMPVNVPLSHPVLRERIILGGLHRDRSWGKFGY